MSDALLSENNFAIGLNDQQKADFEVIQNRFKQAFEQELTDSEKRAAMFSMVVASLAVCEILTDEIMRRHVVEDSPLGKQKDRASKETLKRLACASIKPAGWYEPTEVLNGLAAGKLQIKQKFSGEL